MAYFLFKKDSTNIEGTLFKIAANQSDLNNFNFDKSFYTILEDSDENFNAVRLKNKFIIKYTDNNTIVYSDTIVWKQDRNLFKQFITGTCGISYEVGSMSGVENFLIEI